MKKIFTRSIASSKVKIIPKPPVVNRRSSGSSSLSKDAIEKLFRELIRKEFARLGVHLPEEDEVQVDNQPKDIPYEDLEAPVKRSSGIEDDPMDIDLVRLENAKDLLAMKGKVEGTDIQVLADTCANLSWIPKSLTEELGMETDTTRTNKINGVSGEERSLGIVKDVLIELETGCTIKEDLAVVNYPYQEIGLSRPCLRRYNYDVHESREHIAITCDGKNFFIPIVPDKNRNKE